MKRVWLIMILAFTTAWPTYAETVRKTDFAYGIELERTNQEALCSFLLPLDVYSNIVRQDMEDMAVFNNREEAVPFAVWRPPVKQTYSLVRVPFYPLYDIKVMEGSDIALLFKTDTQGTLVRIQSNSKPANRREAVSSYLIDLSKIELSINALQMDWKNRGQNFLRHISLSASDNLRQWHTIVDKEMTAGFYQEGHQLERRLVETKTFKSKYLRLETTDVEGLVDLENILVRQTSTEEPLRQWLALTAEPIAKTEGEYTVTLPGFLPIDRLRVQFPQQNTIAKIQFFSQKDKNSPWIERQSATIYRLRMNSGELVSPDMAFNANGDRYWLMRIDPKGGGIVRVEAGWMPHLLLFTTRGEAPFVLAYGNASISAPIDHGSNLLREIQEDRKSKLPSCAAAGKPPYSIGGSKALKKPLAPQNYKQFALWSVLIFAVLAMAFIALILIRQMTIGKGSRRR